MQFRICASIAFCISFLLLLPTGSDSASLVKLDLQKMATESTAIVHGKVLSSSSRWTEDRSVIVTDVRFQVVDALKGQAQGEVVVTQLGGVVGAMKVEVFGALAFQPGEESILFLSNDARGKSRITGFSQGHFAVERDPASHKKVVRGIDRDQLRALQAVRGPVGRGDRTPGGAVSLDWFKGGMRDLVRDAVKKGGR